MEKRFPITLLDFQRMFPDQGACCAYLEQVRWPDGFACPWCNAVGTPYRFENRPTLFRCRDCQRDTYLTAGTVMHSTRTPLQVWFWAAYLVTTQTPGMSALQFQRQLGLTRYETAFQMLHKLRAAMVRPDRDRIGMQWPVELDETLVGGKTRGEGRGVHHKTEPFVTENIQPNSRITTDGWHGYDNLAAMGYDHKAVVLAGDPDKTDKELPMIHLIFSNLKAWLLGTHHGVSAQHLPAYLNEFVFRFNRRFYPMTAFASALGIGAHVAGPTYDDLYDGVWVHPTAQTKS